MIGRGQERLCSGADSTCRPSRTPSLHLLLAWLCFSEGDPSSSVETAEAPCLARRLLPASDLFSSIPLALEALVTL